MSVNVYKEGKLKKVAANSSGILEMVGATEKTDGKAGILPAPMIDDRDKFFRGDGTWASVNVDTSDLEGRLQSLQSTVDGNTSSISENTQSINTLQESVQTNTANIASNTERIGKLEESGGSGGEYASKEIYGDTFVSMGRKASSEVGDKSFAFGKDVRAKGDGSHAEGYYSTANGLSSHAEGYYSTADEYATHAEGENTVALGRCSHSEGSGTVAVEESSHAEGCGTKASNYSSHSCGKYNKDMTTGGAIDNTIGDVFVIGNGTDHKSHSNCFRVTYEGDVYGTKAYQSSGADYAEFVKPWHDDNENDEDRVGYFVTVKDGLLYKANDGDFIYGITSGNPSVVGNADEDYYWRYERDEFNRIVMEDVPELVEKKDDDGNTIYDEETHMPVYEETGKMIPNARMKLNEDYDSALQNNYVERKYRKEWDYVGMLGVLPVRDDGTCVAGQLCKCGTDGIATLADARGFDTYMVIERINDHVVSVLLK